jgi:uncharacterized protein YuzE
MIRKSLSLDLIRGWTPVFRKDHGRKPRISLALNPGYARSNTTSVAFMIRYDEHAEFQIERRGIAKAWIEEAILNPDEMETKGGRRSFLTRLFRAACYAARCDGAGRPGIRRHRLLRQDKTMRMRVDHAADAVYLNLTDRPIKDSEEVADGIVVDYDEEGRIVGIEILDASKRTEDPTALKQFSFEEA